MKKSVSFNIDATEYELCYTMKSLAMFERLLNRSLTSIFDNPMQLTAKTTIDFTTYGLITGLNLKNEDEAYDLIDEYCAAGGNLDQLNGYIISGLLATGLFMAGKQKPVKAAKATKKNQ